MPTVDQWRDKLGLQPEEIIPMGKLCKLDFIKIIERLKERPDGKYIEVTAITPTPLGEGKSTTSIGIDRGPRQERETSVAVSVNLRGAHHERQGNSCRRGQRPCSSP